MRSRIICGPFWGSFAVSGSFAVRDHLRYCTDHVVVAYKRRDHLELAIYTVKGELVRMIQFAEGVLEVSGITVSMDGHIAVAFEGQRPLNEKVVVVV